MKGESRGVLILCAVSSGVGAEPRKFCKRVQKYFNMAIKPLNSCYHWEIWRQKIKCWLTLSLLYLSGIKDKSRVPVTDAKTKVEVLTNQSNDRESKRYIISSFICNSSHFMHEKKNNMSAIRNHTFPWVIWDCLFYDCSSCASPLHYLLLNGRAQSR